MSRSSLNATHLAVVGMNDLTHKASETRKIVALACVVVEMSQAREKTCDLEFQGHPSRLRIL